MSEQFLIGILLGLFLGYQIGFYVYKKLIDKKK